jgi:hypothetical protein
MKSKRGRVEGRRVKSELTSCAGVLAECPDIRIQSTRIALSDFLPAFLPS